MWGGEILKVIQVIPSFVLGGAETMCENLLYALNDNGVESFAVSLYDYRSSITERLEKAGIKIIYLSKRKGLDLRVVSQLTRIFKKEKPDIIHTHLYTSQYAIPAAILAKVKGLIHTVHSAEYRECGLMFRWFSKYLYRYFNVVPVTLSELIRETIVEQYQLKKENIPVIFNAIDLSKCRTKASYEILNSFKIIHIGRFNEVKNHRMLIKVFASFCKMYPDSCFELIGDGNLEEPCKIYANELEIDNHVVFHGACADVHEFLSDADVFVLPSLCEGIPLTVIEAMGSGMPIVATAVGGVPDMITDEVNGLLVSVDEKELLDALCRLRDEKELRERLGRSALSFSVKFSADNMAKKYISEYLKLTT